MKNTIQAIKNAPDQPQAETSLDYQLARYIKLKNLIAATTKELDEIKDALKHRGTCSTANHTCIVKDIVRTQAPKKSDLIDALGLEKYNQLSSEVHYLTVQVQAIEANKTGDTQ